MRCIFGLLIFFVHLLGFSEENSKILSVAVIGSGPAGLSAALVTSKEKVSTTVFQGTKPGGPLNAITCMGNWPASTKGKGKDVMERLFAQVKRAGVILSEQAVVRVDFSTWPYRLYTEDGQEHCALSVIIATGAVPRRLDVDGEQKHLNKGIENYVYKPDAQRFAGKTVTVVGGGIDAIKKASIVAKSAEKVYLLVRRDSLQKQRWKKRLDNKGKIEVLYSTQVMEILGNSEGLTHIDIVSSQGMKRLATDHLVLAAGITPNSHIFHEQIACDERGFILVKDRTQKTSIPGVFAAGNVTDPHYRQAAISSGDGMKAGYDALEFLNNSIK